MTTTLPKPDARVVRPSPALAWRWAVVVGLLVSTAVVYAPVRHFGFSVIDDADNVSSEPHVAAGLSRDTLRWAATASLMGHWVPLTRASYLLDQAFWHLDPGAMHVENAALHAASALVLFGLLAEATGAVSRSGMVSAIWALHPMHVESVVWLTERRDALSTPFLFASLWAYVRYARGGGWAAYVAALALLAVSLIAKAMGMTAPVLMLLLDVWPLARAPRGGRRRAWVPLLLEKVPFGLLAAGAAAMAMRAQRLAGAAASLRAVPVSARVANALVSLADYVAKLAVPRRLSVVYLSPAEGWPPAAVVGPAIGLTLVVGVAYFYRRRWPWVAVGLAWFLLALLPVSGLAQSGPQSMADRYTYVPSVGLIVAFVWSAVAVVRRWVRDARACQIALVTGTVGVLVPLAVACRLQVGLWRDDATLLEHAIAVTDDNWFAYVELGIVRARAQDYRAAAEWFSRAIKINPGCGDAYENLGNCEYMVDPAGAIPLYQRAIQINPRAARAHLNLGNAQLVTGRTAEAAATLARAAQLDPSSDYARRQLAVARDRLAHKEAAR